MRLHSQQITVMLAITFAMAFALTVALIFISSVDSVAEEVETTPQSDQNAPLPTTTADTMSPAPTPSPTAISLDYVSNHNGTCTVMGIGNYVEASVIIPEYSPAGDRVTAIAPQAFFGCATATAIHIPASVSFIGNLAFAECKNLAYISVSAENSAYRDVSGVLYSADLSVLILYPPKHAGETVTVETATTVIREMAFYECAYLRRVRYTGSAAQWEKISIGTKNYALLALAKDFLG